jgi:hypothetical protein
LYKPKAKPNPEETKEVQDEFEITKIVRPSDKPPAEKVAKQTVVETDEEFTIIKKK